MLCQLREAFFSKTAYRAVIVVVGALALMCLATPAAPRAGALVWNYTPSIPLGLYRIEHRPWRKGDRVAVVPSSALADTLAQAGVLERNRLLLKRVAATQGDEVCRLADRIVVNGVEAVIARLADSVGSPLPSWSGCRRLVIGEVFLLGEAPASFDGRYFGTTEAKDILGPMQLLLQLPS